jgi:dihydrofolate reductase
MISGHVFIATSLDGFIAKLDGGIEWLISRDDPAEDHGYDAFIKGMDGIIMGRGTYEKALTFDPWPYTVPVVVLSKSLTVDDVPAKQEGKVRILDMPPSGVMALLESEGWSRVYVDGGLIIQSFLRERLISDMVITAVPVLLGEGLRLFGPLNEEISLTHQKTTVFPSGLVQSTYAVSK